MENPDEGGLIPRRQGIKQRRDLEFLEALEEVEKQFLNAYESGKNVSNKLVANIIPNKSAWKPKKLICSLTRSRCKLVVKLSKNPLLTKTIESSGEETL